MDAEVGVAIQRDQLRAVEIEQVVVQDDVHAVVLGELIEQIAVDARRISR
jgi:hypothetical protein